MQSNNRNSKSLAPVSHPEILEDEPVSAAQLAQVWARRAYQLAEEPPPEVTGETLDLLVFWMGPERYGIEVSNVREIFPAQQLTPVPRTPNFVAGVFSARGRIISVIDLQAFLGLSDSGGSGSDKPEKDQAKIIVVSNNDFTATAYIEVGILVEEVTDVVTLFEKDIEPPLTTHTGAHPEYLRGITADMLAVLNLDAILNDNQLIVSEELR
jgi:purine-binding chemotaxis protein CheW